MSKKNLILGGVLAVLIAFSYIWSGPLQDWKSSKSQEKNFLATISAGDVSRIEIASAGNKTVLEKDGELWRVNGAKDFYVKKEVAASLSTALSEAGLKRLEVVSGLRDKKSSFGADDQGLKVKIVEPGKTLDFVIGQSTPDLGGTYISSLASEKTYSIGLDLNGLFGREEWRDDTVFSFMKERATKVRFQYGKDSFIVENKENKWAGVSPKKFTVNNEKIVAILGILENLTAAKIPAQDFKGTGLEKNSHIIQVSGEALDVTLMIGDCTKDNLCYVKRGNSDNIYMITKAQKDALNKKMTDLK
jgi:hypothetical protein